MKQMEVVAAIIRKAVIEQRQSDANINSAEREQTRSEIKGDKIFATQRGYGEWKDWWEFPGGKMEAGQWNVLENVLETSASLAAYFGGDARTIRRDLNVLQTKRVIRHDGPDKGGRWIILAYSTQGVGKV